MEERIIEATEKSIKKILDDGINTTNLEHLYKLSKINHIAKEGESMRYEPYGNYGRRDRYSDYDRDSYGRRGIDERYRGHDYIDRIHDNYGRYEEGRREYNRGNYGAKDDTLKSLEHMLESATDFFKMLKDEASSQEEINLVRKYAQKISQL